MKKRTCFALVVAALLSVALGQRSVQAQDGGGPRSFEPTGVAAGAAEAVLPGGALVHAELASLDGLLGDLNDLGMSFLPQEVVPAHLRPALDQPRPIVSLLGMQAFGAPISTEQLSGMLGIDHRRPASLTIYSKDPERLFVLALPVSNYVAATGLVLNATRAGSYNKMHIEGGSAYELIGVRDDLPGPLMVVCSPDTLYVTADRALAELLLAGGEGPRLTDSALLARAREDHAGANLLVVADAQPLRPLLGQVQGLAGAPGRRLPGLRRRITADIGPEQLRRINMQLQSRLGVRDLEQLMDYVEALTIASWQAVFEELYEQASKFDGITLAVDLDERYQRLELAGHSRAIDAEGATQPLPLAQVKGALAQIPAARSGFAATGRAPAGRVSPRVEKWLALVEENLLSRNLPMGAFGALKTYLLGRPQPPQLEERVAWSVRVPASRGSMPDPAAFDNWQAFVQQLLKQGALPTHLVAMPRQDGGALEALYTDWAQAMAGDRAAYRKLLADTGVRPPMLKADHRFHSEAVAGGVRRFVLESSYTTPWGLFGFSEHELVNRWMALSRDVGQLTFLHEGARDPAVLLALQAQPSELSPALAGLIDLAPEGANAAQGLRTLHLLPEVVDYLARIEDLTHREMQAYLDWANGQLATSANDEQLRQTLVTRNMPPLGHQLRFDPAARQFYLVTVGGLSFPRPKVVGELVDLLALYASQADHVGGAAVFTRTLDGRSGLSLVQDTAALATLVRTAVNTAHARYVGDPAGRQRLEALLRTPLDRTDQDHPVVLENIIWAGLYGSD